MVNVLMYSTNNTACRSAPLCPAPQFIAVPEPQPSHYRLQALAELLVTSDSRRRLGWFSNAWDVVVAETSTVVTAVDATGDAFTSAGNWAVTAAEDVADWFEGAVDSVAEWFDDLAKDIQCARPPLRRSGILACATC